MREQDFQMQQNFHARSILVRAVLLAPVLIVLVCPPYLLPQPAESAQCALKYPIVLSHHWGVAPRVDEAGESIRTEFPELPPRNIPLDNPHLRQRNLTGYHRYFSHEIIQRIRGLGTRVYISDKSAFAGNDVRAKELRATVLRALRDSGADRVNIIGHSQGSQDSREMISNLKRFDSDHRLAGTAADFSMGAKVASWTGLAGESLGTMTADLGLYLFDTTWDMSKSAVLDSDGLYQNAQTDVVRKAREAELKNNFRRSLAHLTTDYMLGTGDSAASNQFSAPDYPGVYYQTYAARIRYPLLEWTDEWYLWLLMLLAPGGGANDGYTTVDSQSYGVLRGVLEDTWGSPGVHHMYFTGRTGKQYASDDFMRAPEFYERLVCDLHKQGY